MKPNQEKMEQISMQPADVPSPIDFRIMRDACDWESTAMDRPFRLDIFERFSESLDLCGARDIVELGSGPGFLAEYLLGKAESLSVTLLDFSGPMHQLARKRLDQYLNKIRFVKRNFKEPNWTDGLGKFDAVVTNQTVHELRHKRYASSFHRQVKNLLKPEATYLICDHYYGEGGMENDQLYMTVDEHLQCLEDSGYEAVVLLKIGSLVLIEAN